MSKTSLIVLCISLALGASAVPAPAQTPPPGASPAPDSDATPPELPGRERAIIGGKRVQPHSEPGQAGQSPEAQIRLLQRGAKDLPPDEPVVVPRDIYGNPLGGNPGLNPPGLEPPPTAEAKPKP